MTWKNAMLAWSERVRRGLWRLTAGAVLLGLMGVNGCPDLPDAAMKADILQSLSLRSATRGSTRQFTIEVDPGVTLLDPPVFDVTDRPEDDVRVGTAPLPPGILAATFGAEPIAGTKNYPVTLSVAGDAPLGPIYFRAASHFNGAIRPDEGEPFVGLIYGWDVSSAFQIYTGPTPPAGSFVSPQEGRQGATIDVAFSGLDGLDQPVTVIPANPGITVESATLDAGANRINARLNIGPSARTGDTWFVLQSGAGNRSEHIRFEVKRDKTAVLITGMYPDPVQFHSGSQSVWVAGQGFSGGTFLTQGINRDSEGYPFDAHGRIDPSVWVDHQNLSLTVRDLKMYVGFSVGGDPNGMELTAHAFGGDDAEHLDFEDPSEMPRTSRPRLKSVHPNTVVAGVPVQVRLEVSNITADGTTLIGLPSDLVEEPIADLPNSHNSSVRFVPGSTPEILVAEFIPSAETGPFRLALEIGSVNTAAIPMEIIDPPEAGKPMLTSASVGRIARGADLVETLRGRGLVNVDRVFLASGLGQIQQIGDAVSNGDGTELTVTLRASPTAFLTGDVATNIQLVTRGGVQSNPLSYTVVDSTCEITGGGVDLRVTGITPSRTLQQPNAAYAASTASQTHVSVYLYDSSSYQGFDVDLGLTLDAIHTGDVPVDEIRYATAGLNWRLTGGTVKAVEIDATHVGLCIDVVIPGTMTGQAPSQVNVKGYIVVRRSTE